MKNAIKSLLLVFLIAIASCVDDNKGGDPCQIDFDQMAMFTEMADNLIIPAYENLGEEINELNTATIGFTGNLTVGNLQILKAAFNTAYLVWQQAAPYEFGPADEVFLRSSLNNFPANTDEIDANIDSGNYDFNQPDRYDKGFPALDYLLFAETSEEAVVTAFANNPQRVQYLKDVVADMKSRVDATLNGWKNNGYRLSFIENTGTAAGSSLSLVVNNLNEYFEAIRRDKVGIPSGILTIGLTNPTSVEAYYSGSSIPLLDASVLTIYNFYNAGLDEYLQAADAEKNGKSLDTIIKDQFDLAIAKIDALGGPLSEEVDTNAEAVQEIYAALAQQVVNLKTDLPSVLCVSITYVDNPSDSD